MSSHFNEVLIFPVIAISIIGFIFICKHTKYGTSRSISIFLWGLAHLIPMLVATITGSDGEINHDVIWMGYLSFFYMTFLGAIFMCIAFIREPGQQGEYFADGPNWPT